MSVTDHSNKSVNMSAEEDSELRDLVIQTLENKGIIGKIKAELRASVFLALEEHDGLGNGFKQKNKELRDFLATDKGWTMVSLVREFLQYFHLDFTLAVFDPEICAVRGFLPRKQLCEQMKLEENKINNTPLLAELVQVVLTPPTDNCEEKLQVPDTHPEQENQKEILTNPIPKSIQDESTQKVEKNDENDEFSLKSDPFYDDIIPLEKKLDLFSFKKDKDTSKESDLIANAKDDSHRFVSKEIKPVEEKAKQSFSTLSSLQDLPSISMKKSSLDTEFSLNYVSKEAPRTRDEDYEDDFYSSLSNHSGKSGQHGGEIKGDSSEHSVEEEIEEDLSALGDDILNSSISFGDEATTTEHTLSQASAVAGYDYIESIT